MRTSQHRDRSRERGDAYLVTAYFRDGTVLSDTVYARSDKGARRAALYASVRLAAKSRQGRPTRVTLEKR